MIRLYCAAAMVFWAAAVTAADEKESKATDHVLIRVAADELNYSMKNLEMPDGTRPYFIAYTITDRRSMTLAAELGALSADASRHNRLLDVDVRVGDYRRDNSHQIRGGGGLGRGRGGGGVNQISIDDAPDAIRHALWLGTDRAFKTAARRYQRVLTNIKTTVEEEDDSDDFSRAPKVIHGEPPVTIDLDRELWAGRLRQVSALARQHPLIYSSGAVLSATTTNRFMVTSEETRLQTGQVLMRLAVSAATRADDGMELSQTFIFNASSVDKLPREAEIAAAFTGVIDQVLALREAPLVEPYTGPAILLNRASGVFFHEIFGHRIEGHRQRDVEEGQTFARKIDEPILPDFLSVSDDPTRARFGDEDLRGYYKYDDEGVEGSRVRLIEDGVLKTFLLSRTPVQGFPRSNGHGRRQPGRAVVARQGNLIVESTKQVSFNKLREMLIAECKSQQKPYGFIFEDITGGFTTTRRAGAQAFKVLPVVVKRVYADGRPDELVRGVDIVGTPLSCFSKIMCTADDPAVFNGTCGAESGSVPVSAIAPSILVSQIEIEKRQREQERLPILASPLAEEQQETTSVSMRSGRRQRRRPTMMSKRILLLSLGMMPAAFSTLPAMGDDETPQNDVIMRALIDELDRSVSLRLEDLPQPYFIAYAVSDSTGHRIDAARGALTTSNRTRSRMFDSRVRVGSYELDNTNFIGDQGGGAMARRIRRLLGGGGTALPLDDDYAAIRQAVWLATDRDYKSAVETLTDKIAYLKDKRIEGRPNDFSEAPAVQHADPVAAFELDQPRWEDYAKALSARLAKHDRIQDSAVQLVVGTTNNYLVSSEGTRLRTAERRARLTVRAECQGEDGHRYSDRLRYNGHSVEDLPPLEKALAEIDRMASNLMAVMDAPRLKEYVGPVLLDGLASPQIFASLLARGVAGQAEPMGSQGRRGRGAAALQRKLGKRILPDTFQVYDDPSVESVNGTVPAGHYRFDREGVRAQRVNMVVDGKLTDLAMSRTPTRKLLGSNGHGRQVDGTAAVSASIGCLFIEDDAGLPAEELKQSLRDAAADQDLAYGLRITMIDTGGQGNRRAMRAMGRRGRGGRGSGRFGGRGGGGQGDPVYVYKVYVADGREELVTGCEFDSIRVSALKEIIASGKEPTVFNRGGRGVPTSIIAPAVLFEEIELQGIQEEFDTPPVLPSPTARAGGKRAARNPRLSADPDRSAEGTPLPRRFAEYDENGDGKIQLDEAPERLRAAFDRFDANEDGAIDGSEFAARGRRGRRGGPGGRRGGGRMLAERLKDADANGDGKIERSELPPEMDRLFDRLDTNEDSVLDESEVERAARRGGRRDRGPRGNRQGESEE